MERKMGGLIWLLILAGGFCYLFGRFCCQKVTVYEYQRGLRYKNGKFIRVLEAGQYWIPVFNSSIRVVDVRPKFATIPGQEVLSSDSVTIKISLAAHYEIT